MSMFKMVFVGPVPNASRGANMFAIQPSKAADPIELQAVTIDDALDEASEIWARMTHTRFMDPDGYWVVDAADKVLGHEERDEAATPRSPADLFRIEAFTTALVSAGGGLVLVEQLEEDPEPGFECDLEATDLVYDAEDRIDLADLIVDEAQRALIARHPVARDPVQLERTLAFLAGTRAAQGTVGDLQRAWLGAAAGLASMAKVGLLIAADGAAQEMPRAA